MFSFATKSRRQRINQRNRTERLSDLLDWKRMGLEYSKARQLALRRAYPDSFGEDDFDFETGSVKISRPLSAPGSPSLRSGMRTPGSVRTYSAYRLTLQRLRYPDGCARTSLGRLTRCRGDGAARHERLLRRRQRH